jgi:hypothetical protein
MAPAATAIEATTTIKVWSWTAELFAAGVDADVVDADVVEGVVAMGLPLVASSVPTVSSSLVDVEPLRRCSTV